MKIWEQPPNIKKSELHLLLLNRIERAGLPPPAEEYYFAKPDRMWRWDVCWPDVRLAVEIQGGGWVNGRHNRPQGYATDCEKANAGVLRGWRLLRYTGSMIKNGTAAREIAQALGAARNV